MCPVSGGIAGITRYTRANHIIQTHTDLVARMCWPYVPTRVRAHAHVKRLCGKLNKYVCAHFVRSPWLCSSTRTLADTWRKLFGGVYACVAVCVLHSQQLGFVVFALNVIIIIDEYLGAWEHMMCLIPNIPKICAL